MLQIIFHLNDVKLCINDTIIIKCKFHRSIFILRYILLYNITRPIVSHYILTRYIIE